MTQLDDLNTVVAFLEKHDPKIAKALLKDFDNISRNINVEELANLIEAGDYNTVLNTVEAEITDNNFEEALTVAFIAGGGIFASFLPTPVHFDILSPQISLTYGQYRRAITAALTSSVMDDTAYILNQILMTPDVTPLQMATRLVNSIGLTSNQWQAVSNYRHALETRSLAALRRELRDKTMDPTITALFGQRQDLSESKINMLVNRYTENYKRLRAKTIAETESVRAYHMAQDALLNEMVQDGDIVEPEIRRFWIHMSDERVRASHRQIPRMNPTGVRLGEPFQTPLGPLRFPGDPAGSAKNVINCRCVVRVKIGPE